MKSSSDRCRDVTDQGGPTPQCSPCNRFLKQLSERHCLPRPKAKGESGGDFFALCPNGAAHRGISADRTLAIHEDHHGTVVVHCTDRNCGLINILESLDLKPSDLQLPQGHTQHGGKPTETA
jgi:hypothetical protein